jgi:hypothetical protein
MRIEYNEVLASKAWKSFGSALLSVAENSSGAVNRAYHLLFPG